MAAPYHKSARLANCLIFSTAIHAALTSLVLALPVYTGPGLDRGGFPVFLVSEGVPQAERAEDHPQGAPGEVETGGWGAPALLVAPRHRGQMPLAEARSPRPEAPPVFAPSGEGLEEERPLAVEQALADGADPPSEGLEVFIGAEKVEGGFMASSNIRREVIQGVEVIVPRLIANEPEPPPLQGPPSEALPPEASTPAEPESDSLEASLMEAPEPEPPAGGPVDGAEAEPELEAGGMEAHAALDKVEDAVAPAISPSLPIEDADTALPDPPLPTENAASAAPETQGPPEQQPTDIEDGTAAAAEEEAATPVAASAAVEDGAGEGQASPDLQAVFEAGIIVEGPPYLVSEATSDMVAAVLTPEENTMPSPEEYMARLSEADNAVPSSADSEVSAPEESGGAWGIPLPVRRDIEVEVALGAGGEGLSFGLLRKPHPMAQENRGRPMGAEDLGDKMLDASAQEGIAKRRQFVLAAAEKGAYAFIMENGGDAATVDIKFTLAGGLEKTTREYRGVGVGTGDRIRFLFLMPEAVFWDDRDFYTGVVEGPHSVTKFNDVTGLVWKETNEE